MRWRQGRCLPYGEGITFWALGEIVKAEAGMLETDDHRREALAKLERHVAELFADEAERAWIVDDLRHSSARGRTRPESAARRRSPPGGGSSRRWPLAARPSS